MQEGQHIVFWETRVKLDLMGMLLLGRKFPCKIQGCTGVNQACVHWVSNVCSVTMMGSWGAMFNPLSSKT